MDIILDQEVRPLDNDQLVYKVTSTYNSESKFNFGDIVNIQWQNLTTDDHSEDNYYLSSDEKLCETPFIPLIQMLTRTIGCCCTVEINCKGRFLSENHQASSSHEIVLEFKKVLFSKKSSNFVHQEKFANLRKVNGNKAYGEKQYESAIRYYKIASEIVEDLPLRVDSIKFSCLNNMAACYMQIGDENDALTVLNQVESVEPDNVKMLWRTGRALLNLGGFKEAERYLLKAKDLDEESGVIKKDLVKVRMCLQQEDAKQKELYKKMMSTLTANGDDKRVESAKVHIGELNARTVVEKETESEVERVEATKELNQFIENSAEKVESDKCDTVEEDSEQGSTAEGETSSSNESEHEIEYEKLDTPCPSLLAGSPDKYEPTFEQEAKEIQNEIHEYSSTENWTENVVETTEPETIEEVRQVIKEQNIEKDDKSEDDQKIDFDDLPELDAIANSYVTANSTHNPLENTTFNFSEQNSQEAESDEDDSVATEQLLGETIDDSNIVNSSFEVDENKSLEIDESTGDAVAEVNEKAEENKKIEETVSFEQNLRFSEQIVEEPEARLPSEPCLASVCEEITDYDQEGASSYVLPPERDQFSRPGLESIDEVEATEVSDNEPQEEEAESTWPVNIPINNDDFFEEDAVSEPEINQIPVEVEPVSKSSFTPIQARNQAMRKVPEKTNKTEEKNLAKKSSPAIPDFAMFGLLGVILAAVAIRFLS